MSVAATSPAPAGPTGERVPWFALAVFGVVSFGGAWLLSLPMWLGDGLASPLTPVLLVAIMTTPLLGTAAALVAERRRPSARRLGLWPLRPLGRTLGVSAGLVLGAPLIVFAGLGLAAAFGAVTLDLASLSGFRATLEAAAPGSAPPNLWPLVLAQLAILPLGALVNAVPAFGEEIGWRGWLLPALLPLGTWPALLASGAAWGLWHAPIILLGYNFAEPNPIGVALMVGACVLLGVVLGWSRLRTGSVWPAVFGHAAFNASANAALLVAAADTPFDPVAAGPLGWATWIVLAVVIAVLGWTGGFRRRGELVRRAPRAAAPAEADQA